MGDKGHKGRSGPLGDKGLKGDNVSPIYLVFHCSVLGPLFSSIN